MKRSTSSSWFCDICGGRIRSIPALKVCVSSSSCPRGASGACACCLSRRCPSGPVAPQPPGPRRLAERAEPGHRVRTGGPTGVTPGLSRAGLGGGCTAGRGAGEARPVSNGTPAGQATYSISSTAAQWPEVCSGCLALLLCV